MLRDEIAISHEALDEHDVGQATDHLRSWLASRTTSSTRATFAHAAGPRPVNSARYVFLDPHARAFYADWDRAARDVAAILRYAAGRDPTTATSQTSSASSQPRARSSAATGPPRTCASTTPA